MGPSSALLEQRRGQVVDQFQKSFVLPFQEGTVSQQPLILTAERAALHPPAENHDT